MRFGAVDGGSFRDPAGRVHDLNGRILRTITHRAASDYEALRDDGVLSWLFRHGLVVPAREVGLDEIVGLGDEVAYVVEHPRLPFVTYPYEWPFSALKTAALFHLDLHLQLLERQVTLTDASAYNIQFDGAKPVFIDLLSLRPYHEGEYWLGHKQFSEQFLNPLLLSAMMGVAYHGWYRGNLEGIATAELARLLPFRRKLGWRVLTHVALPARFQDRAARGGAEEALKRARRRPFPLSAYRGLLRQLRGWIAGFASPFADTTWADYDLGHGYGQAEIGAKRDFVGRFVEATKPALMWDLSRLHQLDQRIFGMIPSSH